MTDASAKKTSRRLERNINNRDLVLKIQAHGFNAVRDEIGSKMTRSRAEKLLVIFKQYNLKVDPDLKDFVNSFKKKQTVQPANDGEVRSYKVGIDSRVGFSTRILGVKKGDVVHVQYSSEQIVITKEKPE